ncbi:hypothetical protein GGI42DRAFT_145449 [Trichoderma sp. SZMC 28013]
MKLHCTLHVSGNFRSYDQETAMSHLVLTASMIAPGFSSPNFIFQVLFLQFQPSANAFFFVFVFLFSLLHISYPGLLS